MSMNFEYSLINKYLKKLFNFISNLARLGIDDFFYLIVKHAINKIISIKLNETLPIKVVSSFAYLRNHRTTLTFNILGIVENVIVKQMSERSVKLFNIRCYKNQWIKFRYIIFYFLFLFFRYIICV